MGIYLSKDGISYLWSKIKNKFYIKPSTGIPKSDLASSVQTSLGKADTALQKHQDISGKVDNTAAGADSLLSKITSSWTAAPTDNTYFIRQDTSSKNEFGRVKFSTLWSYIKSKVESLGYTKNTGTITGIKMNGASKGTSGVVDLGTVITAHQDISGKQDKSTAVTHSANTAVGSSTKPVYIAKNGVATAISHSINADVPANAKFTDTTYSDATQSAHGLMTAADKKKLDGMDLSKYLPKSGGVMTGDIDMQTNKRDILVGTHKANTSNGTAVAGGIIEKRANMTSTLPEMRSFVGMFHNTDIDRFYNLISVRHRNGYSDGNLYGMYIFSESTTASADLKWGKQTKASGWTNDFTLLDSRNYTNYALAKDGTAVKANALSAGHMKFGYITNADATANDGYLWARAGYCVSGTGYDTITLTLLVMNGYAGAGLFSLFFRNSSDGKSCDNIGVEQICTNKPSYISNDQIKFIAVYTGTEVRYELWYKITSRWSALQFICVGEQRYAGANSNSWVFEKRTGSTFQKGPASGNKEATYSNNGVVATATTLTDSGWSSVTTYVVDKSKFNNISTEFRRIGQIAWVKCSFTPNVAMTGITICDVTKVDPFVVVTPANTAYGVGSNGDGTENFIAHISYSPDSKLYLRGNFKPSTSYRLMFSYPVT